jgi:hypothetical protein
MRILLLALAGLLCMNSHALNLQDLLRQDQLRISTWITPDDNIVVGQEVQLTIEIATSRWFAGGTHIRHPEIPQLVILQRDQFATNLSRREAGQTWVVQRWSLELYAQKAGVYQLPPIDLELAVNHATAGIVKGSLQSDPVTFRADIPPGLEQERQWLATTAFSISQTVEPEPTQLQPGDAVQREVRMVASHLSAMMLPALEAQTVEGIAVYPEPPELKDRSNRGEATAERIERVTYIIEKAGQYVLPEQVFYWWNSSEQQVETAVLEAITLDAGTAAAKQTEGIDSARDRGNTVVARLLSWWPILPVMIIGLAVVYLLRRRGAAPPSERALLAQAQRHLRKGDRDKAVVALYQWLNACQPAPDWYQLRAAASRHSQPDLLENIESLLCEVYAGSGAEASNASDLLALRQSHGLMRKIRGWLSRPRRLPLNPGSSSAE